MPSYQMIYPIYIDAKRPAKSGERRVPLSHAVAWPQAQHMAQACSQLGLKAVFDVRAVHAVVTCSAATLRVERPRSSC